MQAHAWFIANKKVCKKGLGYDVTSKLMHGRVHECVLAFWRRHDLPALGQLQHDGGRHRQLGNHVAAAPRPSRSGLLTQSLSFWQSTLMLQLETTLMLLGAQRLLSNTLLTRCNFMLHELLVAVAKQLQCLTGVQSAGCQEKQEILCLHVPCGLLACTRKPLVAERELLLLHRPLVPCRAEGQGLQRRVRVPGVPSMLQPSCNCLSLHAARASSTRVFCNRAIAPQESAG